MVEAVEAAIVAPNDSNKAMTYDNSFRSAIQELSLEQRLCLRDIIISQLANSHQDVPEALNHLF